MSNTGALEILPSGARDATFSFFEQIANAVVITGIDARIQYVNPAFEKMTGYSESSVIGCNPRILQSGMTSPEIYCAMWNALGAGDDWAGELQNRRKNGDFYWESITISPIKGSIGQTTHYLAIESDISSKHALDNRAREEIEKLRLQLKETRLPEGLLPICAGCKRVRREGDSWQDLDRYICEHAGVQLTHGMCPECLKKWYKEFLSN